ncbi:MAG TPA: hypothetical protein VE954_28825 [Oligoflexus sp.]|uniref:hypothetical protein n=1 Tax=Oligoflexus sp. TaxID=1971216 RepID=UPI002D568FA8|nr:hypothetical protein [Oligoflexus sp.]HYX37125.1 hypothetical protein [Oligoflexus sp.]
MIAGSLDNAVRVWDLETTQLVDGPIKVGYFGMDDVVINSAGNIYATTVNTSIIRIWGSNGKNDFVQAWTGHVSNSSVRSLALDEKHQRLFSGGTDGKIMAWDMNTGKGSTVDQVDTVYDLELSPQKDFLYASSKDGRVRRYSLETLAIEPPVLNRPETWSIQWSLIQERLNSMLGAGMGLFLPQRAEKTLLKLRWPWAGRN